MVGPTFITLDRSAPEPLGQQIFRQISHAILTGALATGEKLASSRTLATDLRCARNTVKLAYERLEAEGLIATSERGGSFALAPPIHGLPTARSVGTASSGVSMRLSREFERLRPLADFPSGEPQPFRLWESDVSHFPYRLWTQLFSRAWRTANSRVLTCHDPRGYPPLREAIARLLKQTRGIDASLDQVIVTNGSSQAYDLVTRLMLDPDDRAWIEDPGYLGTRVVLGAAMAVPVPVIVDQDGLVVEDGIRKAPDAKLAFVLPSNHIPTGVTMPLTRRLALLAWAREADAYIVEDDDGHEYRYSGVPQPLSISGHSTLI